MEQLILIMLNAGDEAIQAGIKTGLDIAYAYFKKQVEESRTPIDDKVLQIIVNAIHDWTPKIYLKSIRVNSWRHGHMSWECTLFGILKLRIFLKSITER